MNLYKIEYEFNKDAFEKSNGDEAKMQEYFVSLNTHVLADSFLQAIDKVRANHPSNEFVSIGSVKEIERGIKIL